MTLLQLETKRAEILSSVGVARVQFGERSVEYSRQSEALEIIDREIMRAESSSKLFTVRTRRGLR